MVAEVAWKDARNVCNCKYSMDGISVTMAVTATCGPQISVQIGQQFERDARMQLDELWKFLEKMTRAVLLPAQLCKRDLQERLQAQIHNMRQGADESLEVYIARIQKIEADLSMVSDSSDRFGT